MTTRRLAKQITRMFCLRYGLKALKDISRIQVIGHTDNTGEAEHNLTLSERRAESVAAYLLSHGLDSHRIITAGEGERDPIVGNETADQRARNRRVVLIIAPLVA